jgi:hypothetical protein
MPHRARKRAGIPCACDHLPQGLPLAGAVPVHEAMQSLTAFQGTEMRQTDF